MIKLTRSEALWIVRGIRLGKFLRCCARAAYGLFHRGEQPLEAATDAKATRSEQAPAKPSVPAVEAMKVIQSGPAKSRQSQAACKGKRGRKRVPADRLARARAHASPPRLDH